MFRVYLVPLVYDLLYFGSIQFIIEVQISLIGVRHNYNFVLTEVGLFEFALGIYDAKSEKKIYNKDYNDPWFFCEKGNQHKEYDCKKVHEDVDAFEPSLFLFMLNNRCNIGIYATNQPNNSSLILIMLIMCVINSF